INQAAAQFGSAPIIEAIDARRRHTDGPTPYWEVLSHGGTESTGLEATDWAREMARRGAGEILLTSMDRDGTKEGFDLALTHAVASAVNIPVIASGGVGNLQHLADGIIKGGAQAVLAASLFHFGQTTIAQAKTFLAEQGVVTRPLPAPAPVSPCPARIPASPGSSRSISIPMAWSPPLLKMPTADGYS